MTRRQSLISTLLTGIILAGIPLMAMARHNYIHEKDVQIEILSAISPRAGAENFDIWSEINMLNLSELSGSDSFLRGQNVFVHMSKGPKKVAYPFAITGKMPEISDPDIFAIRGKVSGKEDNILFVRYNFETFLPPKDLKSVIRNAPNSPSQTTLAINDEGISRLVSVEINGEVYPYRKTVLPAPNGLTQ